ncbi:uncharacterized protein I303_107665 [Kwoniella dejecticola CBS 10117]|uniref:Glycosyltransferase 61 catalytic domain-containing protein n=1 Tax=Kwoniella dejecticola CBS 10117 TaxID=1296121 RepID=A0A1A5ZVD2_9TREE|nr:uncharacterized protein I303_07675 [Kwoniella dejecticola CBS 10117]OBR81765.1 hypothetical protein I303_07675 [Kwoniella dejecticola CBS 10117]
MSSTALPSFLQGSPPRSPHVERGNIFSSYFSSSPTHSQHYQQVQSNAASSSSSGGSRGMSSIFRPTRRDLLLCLLTLSFSYLLFSTPSTTSQTLRSPTSSSASPYSSPKYRLPNWLFPSTTISGSGSGVCSIGEGKGELTYSESVRTYGFSTPSEAEDTLGLDLGKGSKSWDEGEEEQEDDELEGLTTTLKAHSPGWTVMERLYIHNGSFYAVVDDPKSWPELRMITSTGLPANSDPGNSEAREPKGDEIIFISPFKAMKLWGPRVWKMDGMTFLFNDGQFIDHYYHFAAELMLGAWRAYASYDEHISADGETSLPPPQRVWFLHQNVKEWRDKPKFNPLLMYALFPSVSILYPEDWADFKNQTISDKPKAFMLERALLADRSAAFRGEWTGPTARTVASALHVGSTSRWWWEPIRRQVLRYSGLSEEIISRNLEGHGATDPIKLIGPGVDIIEPLAPPGIYTPVITYISRQSSRRRLTKESHEDLVKALEERSKKLGWELIIVEAEKMTKEEQFALAGRTTIMLGVHGNGLSHLLWMPATPRSAVIEMFFKGGFARDYQWTAHALGIRHFAIQHDVSFTSPNLPQVDYPEGFQGTSITVVGKVVADLIEDRLAGRV